MTKSDFETLNAGQLWALDKLKLSADTLAKLGVLTDERRHFPDLECDAAALVFAHRGGAWKARAIDEEVYAVSPNFRPAFWNLEGVLRGIAAGRADRVYVAHGELSGCALVEAGVSPEAVLTIPNVVKPGDGDGDRYAFVRAAKAAGLAKASAIVWIANRNPDCQSAFKTDPISASNIDPSLARVLG